MTVDPRSALPLAYSPAAARAGLSALLDLDARLGAILRATGEPLVGQMRLTWWHDALARLDTAPPPAEPVLQALAAHVVPEGVTGRELAQLVEGWEALLEDDLDEAALNTHASRRGACLFGLMARLAGAAGSDPVAPAGRGWALADLATHITDLDVAARARAMAVPALDAARTHRWSRAGRGLGAMARIAAHDLEHQGEGGWQGMRHVAQLVWHRLTGR
ncbi:squalene/phytoene synthase family protein [Sphingomonas aracearum]|uniref:Phytoene synthase n=1 Tax=Sphingomonas aracearum TaxID=2283317 RepID=A0A369VS11_9SPHN|nr:squalene/phytoene synthase family protein [Sphingomonas aracearum]RDE05178.1 hypothetical protein DVW87_07830 [Sphingomonas aracearum]